MAAAPVPVVRRARGTRTRYTAVAWLNLLCLDAPLVAVTWQWFFAHSFHLQVGWPARVALFLTAWLIYLADRLGDALILDAESEKSWRAQFCSRHRRAWWVGLIAVGLLDGWTVLRLDREMVVFGAALALASGAYLVVNYWLGKLWRRLPLKECCIGFLFAAGTVFSLRPALSFAFVAAFLLFTLLCILNCLCIAAWEIELDLAQGKHSMATRWPHLSQRLRAATWGLALVSLLAALGRWTPSVLAGAVGFSALLLGGLDLRRDFWSRDERTALADLVLLTPLLFFLFAL